MSSFEATLHQLPRPILDKLRAVIRRVRRLLLVRGLCATLAVGLLCLLTIMAIDATVTLFSGAARWALSLGGLALTVATAWWFLVRPLSRKITLTHIARILEIRHPELQERISTAVELMSSDDPESVKGSEELIAAVVDSAVEDVGHVDPKTEFKGGRASRFALAAGIGGIVLLLLFAVWPRQAGVLVARAVAPFLDIGNAWSDTLDVQPGDVRIAIGDTVTIEMTVKHDKLKRAEIRRTLADGQESVERMTSLGKGPDGARRFTISFPAVEESFDYRIRAGSAVSEFYAVEAVPKPVVESLVVRYDFPEYTGRDPVEQVDGTGEIRTLAHTRVTVTAATNKPVSEANLKVLGVPTEVETTIEPEQVISSFVLAPNTESLWRLDLSDADGFENDFEDRPITALPDLSPQVVITSPTFKEMKLRPSELLPIRYSVADDVGLSEITLLVTPSGEAIPREIAQPSPEASDGQPGSWHGLASLNLAELAREQHQKRLIVQLSARDNLPIEYGGPNEGFSEKLIITIDENAKTLAEQTLAAQKEEIRDAINKAEQELREAKSEVQQAERQLAREDKVSTDTMRDLDEFREKADAAQETLREVAERAKETAFKEQGEQLKDVAEEEVAQARESADMIPVTDEKDERIADARDAQQQVEQALKDLQEIERSLGESDEDMRMVAELNELANDQRQLAQEAAERADQDAQREAEMAGQEQEGRQQPMDEEMRRQMAEFRQQQEQVQKELGEMLRESPEALRDILAQQQQEAAELAEQAEAISQEQESLKELTEAAAGSEAQRQEEFKEQLMASLGQVQEQIARETQALQEQLENQQAQSGEPLQQASEQTQEASDSLNEQNMESASEAAQQASEALSQASDQAESLAEQQEGQPQEGQSQEGQSQEGQSQEGQSQEGQSQEGQSQMAESGQEPPENGVTEPGIAGSPTEDPFGEADSPSSTQMAEGASSEGSPLAAEETRAQLAELAEQQQAVAQQLEAIEAGQLDEALAMMEQQLAQETQSLQQQAEALEQATEAAQQWNAKSQADQAENALEGAVSQAQQASERLAQAQEAQNAAQKQGQPANQPVSQAQQALNQSRGNQNQAQQAMSRAAQSLQQASEMLAQSLENLQATPEQQSDVLNPDNLSEAFDDTSQSAQSENSQQAAQNAQQAAESLQQLAQAAMEQMGAMGQQQPQPGQPNQQGQPEFVEGADPQLNETGMKTADINGDGIPPELKELGISAADWARLKGNLRSGGTTQGGDDLPAEYRDLVGRYFQVIAREAGKSD